MFNSRRALGIAISNLILFTFDNNIGLFLLLTTIRNILPVAYTVVSLRNNLCELNFIDNAIKWLSRSALMDLYFVVLIWISFAWYILVSTGKDFLPTLNLFSSVSTSNYLKLHLNLIGILWILYFHIIRDVTAVYISLHLWLTGILCQLGHDCLELAPTRTDQSSWVELG